MPKINKTPEAIVVRLPNCNAISSGYDDYDGVINKFMGFLWSENSTGKEFPMSNVLFGDGDFILFKENGGKDLNWVRAVPDSVTANDTAPYKLGGFPGGLYAVAPCVHMDMESLGAVLDRVYAWLKTTGFRFDETRGFLNMKQMVYMHDDKEITDGLGYGQWMIYVPVKRQVE